MTSLFVAAFASRHLHSALRHQTLAQQLRGLQGQKILWPRSYRASAVPELRNEALVPAQGDAQASASQNAMGAEPGFSVVPSAPIEQRCATGSVEAAYEVHRGARSRETRKASCACGTQFAPNANCCHYCGAPAGAVAPSTPQGATPNPLRNR